MAPQPFAPTPQQMEAIETTGCSVIVSAAAGSGKTAVLARRCAYLVCDAPPGRRCDVDQLLVLTFTEAAAAEMRSRIIESIRERAYARPADHRLLEQLFLAESAQISTIHSFCLWLVRRWFSEIGVDPLATIMDAEECALLKKDVLRSLFERLYFEAADPDDALGETSLRGEADGTSAKKEGLAQSFCSLVDDYGLGDDRDIAAIVLRLYDFTTSLPDWRGWLDEAVSSVRDRPSLVLLRFVAELRTELLQLAEYCRKQADSLDLLGPPSATYARGIRALEGKLAAWSGTIGETPPLAQGGKLTSAQAEIIAAFETVRSEIAGFKFQKIAAPRGSRSNAVESAKKSWGRARKFFEERVQTAFALFSGPELLDNLRRTAPYVACLAELVTSFREKYTSRKRELNTMDFSDLERFAYDLLQEGGETSAAARSLHRRFAYVLVDEFQDINPMQQAILRLASRECDSTMEGNLFVVGDVKQSIYRFRLAEPTLFATRLRSFRAGKGGKAVALQSNFRSRAEILNSINLVFGRLMGQAGGTVVYDREAHLHFGRRDQQPRQNPVEIHVLQRKWDAGGAADSENENGAEELSDFEAGCSSTDDPSKWSPIEREAYLIGTWIKSWREGGPGAPSASPRSLRDIAVLLRATKFNGERVAAMLNAMGISAFAHVGGSLFGSREVRDLIAALRALDNPRQDIPLTALLRSGVLGLRLSADELAEVRLLGRGIPFHQAVFEYVSRGPDQALRARLSQWRSTLDLYRERIRRRPLSEIIWQLYEEQGFLAYAGGLPNGPQRRANLLKLHDLARRFGTYRRQGLYRFLQFLESLEADDRELDVAPVIGESEDVVRVMSIHQSKGLEFPVVFVAGLGSKFHLGDRRGRLIFERSSRIGLRVVDTEQMIEYPSAAHTLVVSEIERNTREEELRVLYVAMTRARERLILVGTSDGLDDWERADESAHRDVTRLEVISARSPLQWLQAALQDDREHCALHDDAQPEDARLFSVHLYRASDMADWRMRSSAESSVALHHAVARLEPLPAGEPLATQDGEVAAVMKSIGYVYPHLASTSIPATAAASRLTGRHAHFHSPEIQPAIGSNLGQLWPPGSRYEPAGAGAADRGIVTHLVLERLDFAAAQAPAGLAGELQRLVRSGVLTAADRALVDDAALAWLISTPLADAIRQAGAAYHREFRFVSSEPVEYFEAALAGITDRVLVRGIVDGIIVAPKWLDVVDFKTDQIDADQIAQREGEYRPQVTLYARAVGRLFRRPVRAAHLVFLTPRRIATFESKDFAQIPA